MPPRPASRRTFMIAADPNAPCPLFGGKRVANGGGCNAYNPRT